VGRNRFRSPPGGRTTAPNPNIRDIAERLGVSVATVSRVINDYPDVSPETRERVREAIRKERFVPDRTARSLVTGRSQVVGIILETGAGHPDLQHPFFQEVLDGLKRTVGPSGYDLLLFSTDGSGPDPETRSYLSRIRHHRVDGVVAMGADHQAEMEEVVSSGIPCIGVDLGLTGARAGYVTSDNAEGAALAVRHLHGLGHRRIAHIAGTRESTPGADRLQGFRREIERLGLPLPAEYVRDGDFYPQSGHGAMSALLDLAEPPTAVVAAADLMAAGAIQAAADRGIRVPDDVAVVGFDDIQIAALLRPSLTTIRQDKRGLGAAAGRALIGMIADPELAPPVITLPVELMVRESSGSAPAERGEPATRS
jgi:LacI family transcriptional regulator